MLTVETSPQTYARTGGVLYLIIIVVGLFGEAFVRNGLIVSGDATATAANIRSMESLWRFHIAAELFLLICAVALSTLRCPSEHRMAKYPGRTQACR
jgi:Domain of unknown function (DUF4386)